MYLADFCPNDTFKWSEEKIICQLSIEQGSYEKILLNSEFQDLNKIRIFMVGFFASENTHERNPILLNKSLNAIHMGLKAQVYCIVIYFSFYL